MSVKYEYTAEMAHATVARGAAWLDEQCPDWVKQIDLLNLDLGDSDCCILGQTAECLLPDGYDDSPYSAVIEHYGGARADPWAREHGFDVFPHGRSLAPDYEMLTIAWRELIRQRLEVAS